MFIIFDLFTNENKSNIVSDNLQLPFSNPIMLSYLFGDICKIRTSAKYCVVLDTSDLTFEIIKYSALAEYFGFEINVTYGFSIDSSVNVKTDYAHSVDSIYYVTYMDGILYKSNDFSILSSSVCLFNNRLFKVNDNVKDWKGSFFKLENGIFYIKEFSIDGNHALLKVPLVDKILDLYGSSIFGGDIKVNKLIEPVSIKNIEETVYMLEKNCSICIKEQLLELCLNKDVKKWLLLN